MNQPSQLSMAGPLTSQAIYRVLNRHFVLSTYFSGLAQPASFFFSACQPYPFCAAQGYASSHNLISNASRSQPSLGFEVGLI